jgi:hypothetical protein
MSTSQDFTPTGVKIEGAYENDRNAENNELYKAIIREAYGVHDVIIAHHLVYVKVENRDGFDYQIIEEVPSADTLIFDHDVAQKIWGDKWQSILTILAMTPVAERDKLMGEFYYGRTKVEG